MTYDDYKLTSPYGPDHDPAQVASFYEIDISELRDWHFVSFESDRDYAARCEAADRRNDVCPANN